MSLNAYMTLKGQKTGDIKGSVTVKGREGSILVVDVDHSVVSPRDPQSGLSAGRRMHKPLVITKEVDKSSPLLYNVLVTNENITELILRFWEPQLKGGAGVGAEVQFFTIKLTHVNIASIHFHMGNNLDIAKSSWPPIEEISFVYQKIEWTWMDGGITANDDWNAKS